jgi:hypothetical protein
MTVWTCTRCKATTEALQEPPDCALCGGAVGDPQPAPARVYRQPEQHTGAVPVPRCTCDPCAAAMLRQVARWNEYALYGRRG